VQTISQSVNRDGAVFPLEEPVVVGQILLLVNDHTAKPAECRVASSRRTREGKTYVGVEFVSPDSNFWHMKFPVPGTRALRRPTAPDSSKASA
jgi:hypothetical protein